ncbi:MAG: hypothetical protein KJ574_02450 [Nanoarchaeota archaeon]|nr:hypothetical protein [Nanoarchaeota archaeon]
MAVNQDYAEDEGCVAEVVDADPAEEEVEVLDGEVMQGEVIDAEWTEVEEDRAEEPVHAQFLHVVPAEPEPGLVKTVSLEAIIAQKLDDVIDTAKENALQKLRAREQENLEKKVAWRTEAGKPSTDREEVGAYCRRRWPLHFEEGNVDLYRLDLATLRRVRYELRAAMYFSEGSQLDMLERLVTGADASTGFLGAMMNKTTSRFDILYNYFTSPNRLVIDTDEDYSRLVAVRDSIQKKMGSYYWRKQLFPKQGGAMLKLQAGIVLERINDYIISYEERNRVLAKERQITDIETEFQKEKSRILAELGLGIAAAVQQAPQTEQQAVPYMFYVRDVIEASSKEIRKQTNGSPLPDWKVNKIVRESITRCAEDHPDIQAKISFRSFMLVDRFLSAVRKVEDVVSNYADKMRAVEPSYAF